MLFLNALMRTENCSVLTESRRGFPLVRGGRPAFLTHLGAVLPNSQ